MNDVRPYKAGGQRRCAGLTLVELMIAMVLSLVLMGGVLTIFASGKTTHQLQSGLATVQENGRHALYLLVRDIRGAGFGGCAGIVPTNVNVIANDPPDNISSFTGEEVLWGMNDVSGANPYNAVAGTDVIRVRGAGDSLIGLVGNTVPVNANIQTTVAKGFFEQDDILMITDCVSTDIFRATTVSQSGTKSTIAHSNSRNTSNFLSKPYGQDAFVMQFKSNTYFIRDTGRDNAAGDDILSLWGRDYDDNDLELVDGIEDMQIEYGVDADGNGQVDRFLDAAAVEAGGFWANVLAVRIALLVNSVDNANREAVSYQYVGLTTTPVDASDFRLRQEMTSTVTLRNRVD